MKKSLLILGIAVCLYACGGGTHEENNTSEPLNSSMDNQDSGKVGSTEVAGDGVNAGVAAGTNENPDRPGAKASEDSLRNINNNK